MKVRNLTSPKARLKKRQIELKSEPDLPKYGQIEGLEIEGVLFSLLDGLVETNERIKETIIKTLMKFAAYQPDFILKSILTFLQVQKTSIQHQYTLLKVIKKCILELKNVPNTIVKEILLFVLKEISFIKKDDPRHSEMKEIVSASTALCPMFGVDVTLALIKDLSQGEEYHEILTIYIRVLKNICQQAPSNSYVKSMLISSHLMGLYNKEIFKEQNSKISKELSSLLFDLSKMLIITGPSTHHTTNCPGTIISARVDEGLEDNSELYKSLDLENNTYKELCHSYNKDSTSTECDEEHRKSHLKHVLSPQLTIRNKKSEGKIMRPTMDNIKNILEPLYELLLKYYIPKIYINQSYNQTCLKLLYSLMIMSEFVSIECLKNNSMNLLTCVIVRFLNQVPNLELEDNLWFNLHKINSSTLTTKFVSLFSNQNDDIPPKFFIEGLRNYLQILSNFDQFVICTNSYNLCNIFFSLILTLYNNKNSHLITYLKSSKSEEGEFNWRTLNRESTEENELDTEYVDTIIRGIRTLFEISSSSLMVLEFLYDKATSEVKSEMVVSLYFYIFLLRRDNEGNDNSNKLTVCKIINNANKILNPTIMDNYSLFIIVEFVSMLFEKNYVDFFKHFNLSIKGKEEEEETKKANKKIYYVMNYLFEYQITIEINRRIDQNLKIYNASEESKLDAQFLINLYHNSVNAKNEGALSKFDKSELVENEEELFEECIKKFIKFEGELFLVYLYTKLMNNVKRNSLTVLKYIGRVLKQFEKEEVRKVLRKEELLSLLTIALIYLHDPVGRFGEAFYSQKIVLNLYNLSFERKDLKLEGKELSSEGSERELIKMAGVETYNLTNYSKLDSFYLLEDDDYTSKDKEAEEVYINANNIVSNFTNVSNLIKTLNRLYEVEGSELIKTVTKLMKNLKTPQNLNRSSSLLNTGSSLFSSGQSLFSSSSSTNLLKFNDIVIDTDLSKFQNLGVFNLICIFTNNSNVKRMIKTILSTKGINTTSDKEDLIIANREEQIQENDKKIWTINLEIKYTYLMLHSICISNLSNESNWKEVLLKLDYLLLINPLNDSTFSIFGKTSSYLQSEKIRLIIISTLTNIYLQYQGHFKTKYSQNYNCGNGDNSYANDSENKDGLTKLKEKYNRIANKIQEKRAKILKEKEKETKKEDMEEIDTEEEEEEEDLLERYIICPVISIFNNETDQTIQEFILNNILIIILNSGISNNNDDYSNNNKDNCNNNVDDNVKIDVELFGVIFGNLMKMILKTIDKGTKISSKTVNENFENRQILNLSKIDTEVGEKEQGLPMYAFMTLCAFGPHFKELRSTEMPYKVMYYVIYYLEYHLFTKIAKFESGLSINYNLHRSLRVSKCVQYYLVETYRNLSWDCEESGSFGKGVNWEVCYNMVRIIMSDNNSNLKETLLRNKLFTLVEFLNAILKNEPQVTSKGEDEWTQLVILIWCYILKIMDNNVKLLLIDILYKLFSPFKFTSSYNNQLGLKGDKNNQTVLKGGVDREGTKLKLNEDTHSRFRLRDGEMGVKLDRISKLNSVDSISSLIPENLVVKFFSFSLILLEKPSCLSNSLIKIIHRICQNNINALPRDKLRASLELTFNIYNQYFESNNLPMFLKSFLTDLFKHDIRILLNSIFNFTVKLQSTVVSIIAKNHYLLSLLIDYLGDYIEKQLNKSFNIKSNYHDLNDSDDNSVTDMDDNNRDNCEDNNERGNKDDSEAQDNMDVERVLEYNKIIFLNDEKLVDCYSDYLNLVIIYLNVVSFKMRSDLKRRAGEDVVDKGSKGREEELERVKATNEKILKFLEIFEREDDPKNRSLLRFNVKIIGGNANLLNSFLRYAYNVISSQRDQNGLQESELKERNRLVDGVITKILVDLVKHNKLQGEDERVLKMIRRGPLNYKLVYYYLKNMFTTRVNPYFNLFKVKFYVVQRKRRRFLSDLVERVSNSVQQEVPGREVNYYLKTLSAVVRVVTRGNLRRFEDRVEGIIWAVVRNKTFFVDRKLRHSYLTLFCEIMRYLLKKYKNLGKMDNLKSYFLFPTSVAILSRDSKHLNSISRVYLKLFVGLFFGSNFKAEEANLQEELVSALMVRGYLSQNCICNCNLPEGSEERSRSWNSKLKRGESHDGLDGRSLCLCYSFQLLYFFSFFLPSFPELDSKDKEKSVSQDESSEGKVSVPPDIEDEFKRIKKMQLHKESSKVLFSTSNMEDEPDEEFTDINRFYDLKIPTIDAPSSYNKSDLIRQDLSLESLDLPSSPSSPSCLPKSHKLESMPICPDMLVLLDVSDYSLKQGVPKCNLKYSSDNLDEYFVKYLKAKNISLLQIKTLSAINKSHIFLSKTLYRFLTMQKYLFHSPIQVSLFKTPASHRFSLSTHSPHSSSLALFELIEDPFFLNSIRLSIFILTKSSLYLSKSSKELTPYRDFFSSSQTLSDSELDSVLIRKNQLIHFESLCNVVINKLCKLVESQRFKLFTLKQLHLLSHIVPQ